MLGPAAAAVAGVEVVVGVEARAGDARRRLASTSRKRLSKTLAAACSPTTTTSASPAATAAMSTTATSLEPLFTFLSQTYTVFETNFFTIPGSAVVARYVKSSHQNDPGRTVLEVILILFAIRTLLQSRTRADNSGKHFIKFEEKVRHYINAVATLDERVCV